MRLRSRGQTLPDLSKVDLPAEEIHQPAEKDDATNDRSRHAGQHDGRGGDVQARVDARLGCLIKGLEDRLDGAIEKLGREHHADATPQQAPLQWPATEYHTGRDDERREEEVNEKARVSANSLFKSAQGIAEFVTPTTTRPAPHPGLEPIRNLVQRRWKDCHHYPKCAW